MKMKAEYKIRGPAGYHFVHSLASVSNAGISLRERELFFITFFSFPRSQRVLIKILRPVAGTHRHYA